jgi:hypothetical protein
MELISFGSELFDNPTLNFEPNLNYNSSKLYSGPGDYKLAFMGAGI